MKDGGRASSHQNFSHEAKKKKKGGGARLGESCDFEILQKEREKEREKEKREGGSPKKKRKKRVMDEEGKEMVRSKTFSSVRKHQKEQQGMKSSRSPKCPRKITSVRKENNNNDDNNDNNDHRLGSYWSMNRGTGRGERENKKTYVDVLMVEASEVEWSACSLYKDRFNLFGKSGKEKKEVELDLYLKVSLKSQVIFFFFFFRLINKRF